MAGSAVKVCQICKQDCSRKPRVKNGDGDYFCEECLAQKKAEQALLGGAEPASRRPDHRGDEPASFGMDAEELAPPKGLWDAPEAAAAGHPGLACPKCGSDMQRLAIVCTNCGYNTQGRGRLETKVKKAVDVTPPPAKRRGGWLKGLLGRDGKG